MIIDVCVPNMDGAKEVYIVGWLRAVGEPIKAGDVLVEVMTDKVCVEIPVSESGVVEEILFEPEARVEPGQVVARIRKVE